MRVLRQFTSRFTMLSTAAFFALSSPGLAAEGDLQFPAFAQAVAEAAIGQDEVAAFYRSNGYEPIWTSDDAASMARRTALLRALGSAGDHGLPVAQYDTSAVEAQMRHVASPREQGQVEAELSRIFLTYAHQLQTGILNPRDVSRDMKRRPQRVDGTELLSGLAASDNPDFYIRGLVPDSDEYAQLMHARFELEELVNEGGWGPTVQASKLSPGDSGPAVIALRNRLVAMGYLNRSATMTYDADIQKAVQRFQSDSGLTSDGVAGDSTLDALNISARDRLKSVIVAMERERWLSIDRSRRYIWVNQTDFTARIIDAGAITFETRSVVGQNNSDRRTPEFSDVMEHLIVNPTWNVPRSIATNEYLPNMIQSQGQTARHLQLVDGRGNVVSRESIDWEAVTPANFPFDLKQPPSRGNALGLVKFMFPNPYNIYLHDTPSKSLFARETRTFSHGCVRLGDPFDFAYALLAEQEDDPVSFFQSILRTGRETQVDLVNPVPVHLVYRTAFSNLRGEMSYRRDMYGRDAMVWSALQAAGVTLPGGES
ncbi:MAG: L,D-transpeptidase family protein [Maritimibacter sp.]